eukprot:6205541-Pleurochrysis_carterae.AAC.1
MDVEAERRERKTTGRKEGKDTKTACSSGSPVDRKGDHRARRPDVRFPDVLHHVPRRGHLQARSRRMVQT